MCAENWVFRQNLDGARSDDRIGPLFTCLVINQMLLAIGLLVGNS